MQPSIGRIVHYAPPQGCVGPDSLTLYPAIVTQINKDGSLELTTFGPNSLYYQHAVPFAEVPTSGHWNWPPKI